MGISISTNLPSMAVNRDLDESSRANARNLERIASGNRINTAGDDPSSLAISEKLKGSIRSFQMAGRNTQDGISMLQTAEGGISEAQNILVRLRELSMQAASDTLGDEERSFTNKEFQSLKQEIQRIANTTLYDKKHLLNGDGANLDFQVGIDHDRVSRLSFSSQVANVLPTALGINSLDISTKESARDGLPALDGAISKMSNNRSYLGGIQAELSSHMEIVQAHTSNLAAGNSRLRDTDMAEVSSKQVADKIRLEAGGAVQLQANTMSKTALKLLPGG